MIELPTPETDALDCELHNPRVLSDRYSEMMEHAQKLERERDEAIFSKNTSAADFLKQIRQITLCKDVAREKLLMAEKERDETRKQFVDFLNKTEDYKRERDEARGDLDNMQDQRDLAMKVIKRLEQERDEARAVLREIANASHFDNIGNWARNKAKKALGDAQ
jgi:hypothetical protein